LRVWGMTKTGGGQRFFVGGGGENRGQPKELVSMRGVEFELGAQYTHTHAHTHKHTHTHTHTHTRAELKKKKGT
jgi:hypothetical protein